MLQEMTMNKWTFHVSGQQESLKIMTHHKYIPTYEGWSISNEKNTEANVCYHTHFIVFQYNLFQAKCIFPTAVWAILHRRWRTFCYAVQTSHL